MDNKYKYALIGLAGVVTGVILSSLIRFLIG